MPRRPPDARARHPGPVGGSGAPRVRDPQETARRTRPLLQYLVRLPLSGALAPRTRGSGPSDRRAGRRRRPRPEDGLTERGAGRSPARGRRGRKVYRITDDGRRQFTALLGSEAGAGAEDARSFGLRLAFARYLPPQARLRLLERRRAQLAQRLAETRAATGVGSRLDPYARSLVEHTTESTERDISWLDRLIDAERARAASGTPGPAEGAGFEHNDWRNDLSREMKGMTEMEGETR